jgi:hypothetical protein
MEVSEKVNYRALARGNPIRYVQLRGDPEKSIKLPNEYFQFQSSIINVLSSSSIYNLTKNKSDLIKITSQ